MYVAAICTAIDYVVVVVKKFLRNVKQYNKPNEKKPIQFCGGGGGSGKFCVESALYIYTPDLYYRKARAYFTSACLIPVCALYINYIYIKYR